MSDPESISSGRPIPQWIKQRSEDNKSNFNGPSFSPPSHDDSFFYIRYPASDKTKTTQSNLKAISEALSDLEKNSFQPPSTSKPFSQKDFRQHTEPCKMFLDSSKNSPAAPSPAFSNVKNQTKSFGTDDGFKGAGAACGSSIIKVARQMVSSKSVNRGFTVASFNKDIETKADTADQDSDFDSELMYLPKYSSLRRGSKSLPASPLGSPKSMRKAQPNPYFTGQFTVANSATTSDSQRGWFLSSLLGIQREANSTTSVVSNVSEEAEDALEISSKNSSSTNSNQKVLRARPSELREMNFWSPTSM